MEIQNRLYQYISNGILNTIFYGGPGVGKHTLILNMFRSLNPNLKEKEKVHSGLWYSLNPWAKKEDTTTASIPNPALTSMGPSRFLDRRSKKKLKPLKMFRDYYAEKGIGQ